MRNSVALYNEYLRNSVALYIPNVGTYLACTCCNWLWDFGFEISGCWKCKASGSRQTLPVKLNVSNMITFKYLNFSLGFWFCVFFSAFSETCHLLVIKSLKLEIHGFDRMVTVFGRWTKHLQCEWLHIFLSEVGIIHRRHFLSSNYIRGILFTAQLSWRVFLDNSFNF